MSTPEKREALLMLTNPVEGRDEEFREWYWGTHIPEILELPVFEAAHRYHVPVALTGTVAHRYATLYDIKGSAAEAMNLLFTSGFATSDALDVTTVAIMPVIVED